MIDADPSGTSSGAGTVVVIPTYDESENIQAIVPSILRSIPAAHVWIIDDNSPDGTGDLVDAMAADCPQIRAFHRPQKAGLGTAYVESFPRALTEGFEFIVEMDADFSHDPGVLPDLLRAAASADLVIGSRYVPGGSTPDWTLPRRLISRIGNLVARYVLGLPVHDATTGYRVFSRKALQSLQLDGINLQGYGFQIETVFQCHRQNLRIVEVPIRFIDRRLGQSKMSRAIVAEALVYVVRRRFRELFGSRSTKQPNGVGNHHDPAKRASDTQEHV